MNELERIPLLHIDGQRLVIDSLCVSPERAKVLFEFLMEKSGELASTELIKKVWDNPKFKDNEAVWLIYKMGSVNKT